VKVSWKWNRDSYNWD